MKRKSTNVAADIEDTLADELKRLKEEAKLAHARYKAEADPLLAQGELENWLTISKNIAALAKVAPKADAEAGAVLKRDDVEAAWRRPLLEFRSALENLGRRIATNALFLKLNPVDVELIVAAETNATLTQLANNLSVPPPAQFPDPDVRSSNGGDPKFAEWHELHRKLERVALKEKPPRDWFNKRELIALEKLMAKLQGRRPRDIFGDEEHMPGPGWNGWADYEKRTTK